jgi:hypothetical protein
LYFWYLGGNERFAISCFEHLSLKEDVGIVLCAISKSNWIVTVKNSIDANAIEGDVPFVNDTLHCGEVEVIISTRCKWYTLLEGFELADQSVQVRMHHVGIGVGSGIRKGTDGTKSLDW